MRGGSLMQYARNLYSQNGEDGILDEVFKRLGISRGTFVEFGVGNGVDLSNTLRLAEHGWCGVWIESNMESAAKAAAVAASIDERRHPEFRGAGSVEVLHATVGYDWRGPDQPLDCLLQNTKTLALQPSRDLQIVLEPIEPPPLWKDGLPLPQLTKKPNYHSNTYAPPDLDFLSIDIDSYDYEVWEACDLYRAKVVLIEINSGVPIGVVQRCAPGVEGTSFTPMLELGQRKGYTLVCHTGNLLFVDNSLVAKLNLPAEEIANPESIFNDAWVRWAK